MSELSETFRAYVAAESAASRAYADYQFGKVGEAEVNRLQRIARLAFDAHVTAISGEPVRR